jgi:hypothetical protein
LSEFIVIVLMKRKKTTNNLRTKWIFDQKYRSKVFFFCFNNPYRKHQGHWQIVRSQAWEMRITLYYIRELGS